MEMWATVVIKKSFQKNSTYKFKYGDFDLSLTLPSSHIRGEPLKIKHFKKWNQASLDRPLNILYGPMVLVIILSLSIYFFIKKKRKKHYGQNQEVINIKKLVNSANDRKSIENIYQYKIALEKIYNKEALRDFIKNLNQIQYKSSWTKEEESLLKEKLNHLRSKA